MSGGGSKPLQLNDRWNAIETKVCFDFRGLFPVVEGLDEMPDLRVFAQRNALTELFGHEEESSEAIMRRIMEKFKAKLDEANSKLPKPYGVLLGEMRQLYDEKRYGRVAELAAFVLGAWQDSEESKILRDYALHELGRLPVENLHREIIDAGLILNIGREVRNRLLKEYPDVFRDSSGITQGQELHALCSTYKLSDMEWTRESCIRMMNCIGYHVRWIGKKMQQEFDDTLLEALCDEFASVRAAALNCLEHEKMMPAPHEFFFRTYEKARSCKEKAAKKTLCNALLRQVYPNMDMMMESEGKLKEYDAAIDYALAETGKDPTYYKLGWEGKMMHRIGIIRKKITGKKDGKRTNPQAKADHQR